VSAIAVLDYGIGNLRSAEKALQKVGGKARLVTTADEARDASAVVLPGVGSFGACMKALRSSGLDAVALDAISSGKPFLGICVGMQMLYRSSDESPGVEGLGVIDARVRRMTGEVKLPQMQWNRLDVTKPSPLLRGIDDPWCYFVHSFAAEPTADVVATCAYGNDVVAMIERDNVWATQFHPEKSGDVGLALLRNFVEVVEKVVDMAGTS
jgi:imidazole glycerol-phosphate synthase subunit HisH